MKSPSKYTSLEKLEAIKENNNIGMTGVEYSADEIEHLIYDKYSRNDEREVEELLKSRGY